MIDGPAQRANGNLPAIGAAILLGALCALVVNTLPVFLTVLGRTLSLDEVQVGYVALADMGGIAAGTILCAMLPGLLTRMGWRAVAIAGITVLIAGNVLASQVQGYPALIAARAIAGTGGGVAMAIVYAVLASGTNDARNLALFNVAQLGSGAIGVQFLGTIAEEWGAGGLFLLIAAISVGGLVLCLALPRTAAVESQPDGAAIETRGISGPGWLAILSALLYFAGAGAIFAFLAYMGIAWGGSAPAVESGLSMVLVAGVAGGLVSAFIGSRYHFARPLMVGYAVLLVAIVLLMTVRPVAGFVALASLFGFGWNILTPFQFAAVTHADSSNSAAMLVNASTLGGVAIGPAIAGNFVTADFAAVNMGSLIACALSLGLLVLALKWHAAQARISR